MPKLGIDSSVAATLQQKRNGWKAARIAGLKELAKTSG
jgi:hypothetical protein